MTHADAAIWAAQLADMPLEAILSYLRERGYGLIVLGPFDRFHAGLDALPLGYPPRAEEDVPFEVGRDE